MIRAYVNNIEHSVNLYRVSFLKKTKVFQWEALSAKEGQKDGFNTYVEHFKNEANLKTTNSYAIKNDVSPSITHISIYALLNPISTWYTYWILLM